MRLASCLTACLLATVALAAEPQESPELRAWQKEVIERQWKHAEALAAPGDARSLIQALWVGTGQETATAAQRRAEWSDALRSMPVTEADHAWWHYYECSRKGADCSDAPPLEILVQFDPDNVWTQLLLARAAQREGRPGEALEWLQLAGESDVASSTGRVAALIIDSLSGLELPEPGAAVASELGQSVDGSPGMVHTAETHRWVMAMALFAAYAVPGYSSLSELCRPGPAASFDATWQRACLTVAGRIGREDTTLVGGIVGLSFAVQLATEGDEAATWREAYRRLRYLYSAGTSATLELEQDADAMVDYLKDVLTHGERPALQRLLESRGQGIEPPPDWLPDDARSRALVLGEDEPAS